jgi:putative Mg2+ transporter-C (MgtC) family protein
VSPLVPLAESLRLDVLVQLLLAVLLGGAIGIEREFHGKPAGLRTNILICMGATLFTLLSYRLALPSGDAGRVAAQIVTGIGFLGAGTILHARGSVVGLTSAATIWLVAAVGMALGSHAYVEALGTTILAMIVLEGLGAVETGITARSGFSRLVVRARVTPGALETIETLLREAGLKVESCHVRRDGDEIVVDVDLAGPRRLHDPARMALLENDAVISVSTPTSSRG